MNRISLPSGVAKQDFDGSGHASVFGQLFVELLAARRSDAVLANFASGFGGGPVGFDPALEEKLLQRGLEVAFLDAQLLA